MTPGPNPRRRAWQRTGGGLRSRHETRRFLHTGAEGTAGARHADGRGRPRRRKNLRPPAKRLGAAHAPSDLIVASARWLGRGARGRPGSLVGWRGVSRVPSCATLVPDGQAVERNNASLMYLGAFGLWRPLC